MMKHDGGQHDIELRVRKRKLLGKRFFENDFDAGLSRFFLCPGNHLRRGVHAVNRPCCPDLPFCRKSKRSSTAAHVQNRLARLKMRQMKQPLAEGPLSAERSQPD